MSQRNTTPAQEKKNDCCLTISIYSALKTKVERGRAKNIFFVNVSYDVNIFKLIGGKYPLPLRAPMKTYLVDVLLDLTQLKVNLDNSNSRRCYFYSNMRRCDSKNSHNLLHTAPGGYRFQTGTTISALSRARR